MLISHEKKGTSMKQTPSSTPTVASLLPCLPTGPWRLVSKPSA
ncbi:hypothetical protein FOPG_20134 [Fusarium oxysporum f. sp. conglutinans race 2 54008]|uniref:Uncharacterized protein n=1 Tax=Fusarium oxysporum f. sp. conglutinans race 2 54008 TaxID=1089457 RepID=X0GIW3_FUSOX|nr:hypothetical protein FOPG_20134 [Fusarium oxysporum f. sp. conglutinans race 2 54008]